MTSEVKELVERLQEWATNLDGLAPVEAARGVADLRQAADTLQSQERRLGELTEACECARIKLARYREQHPETYVGGVAAEYDAVVRRIDATLTTGGGHD